MGTLRKYDLSKCGCTVFFETGTGTGASLLHACENGRFSQLYSVEIHSGTAELARQNFARFGNVNIINADSETAFREYLGRIDRNSRVLFFLDAHFPGEVAKDFTGYTDGTPLHLKLPLERELELLKQMRPDCDDIIVVDDLRIYEDGPYEHGNMPQADQILSPAERHIEFIARIFPERNIERDFRDEGYVLITPRQRPFKLKRLSLGYRFKRRLRNKLQRRTAAT